MKFNSFTFEKVAILFEKNGKRHGQYFDWYDNGNLWEVSTWFNGIRRKHQRWNKHGNKLFQKNEVPVY